MNIELSVDNLEGASEGTRLLKTLRLSLAYTGAEVFQRPRNIIIGIIAVMLLVFFSVVLITEIWKAPYILLRLAELTVGEMDIVLHGHGRVQLLNYTELNHSLSGVHTVISSAPRWLIRADLDSMEALREGAHASAGKGRAARTTLVNVLLINSELEKQANIGRGWKHREIGYSEAHISNSAANYIGVSSNKGQRVALSLSASILREFLGNDALSLNLTRPAEVTDALSFYRTAFFALNNIQEDSIPLLDLASLRMGATMVDAVESPDGKYSSALGNIVVMDCRELLTALVDQSCLLGPPIISLPPNYHFPTVADLLNLSSSSFPPVNIQDYAMMVIVMLQGRYDMYYADTKSRGRMLTEKTNKIMEAIGVDFQGEVLYPVEVVMETMDMFRVLATSAFVTVVVGTVLLGAILLFTLLQINAEERQFELAMMRAQGMPRIQIIGILVMQTLAFTLPGIASGLSLAFAVNAVLEVVLSNFTKAPPRFAEMPTAAIVIGTLMGLLLPLAATYGPVKRALGRGLRDALDVYRQTSNEVYVRMIRLEEMGLSMSQVLVSTFLVVLGFLVYYLVPMSLVFSDMMMFFILFDFVLISMIAGLCMVTYVVQEPMETLVLYLLLWGREIRLWTVIQKNLRSHHDRNSKAYMMFLISVACVVASGITFSTLSTVSAELAQLMTGAPVTVTSSAIRNPLDQKALDEFMKTEGKRFATHWAYTSFALHEYPQIASNTQVGNIVGEFRTIGVRAVTEFFMDSTYPDFNMVNTYNDNYEYPLNTIGQRDVIRSMYEHPPRHSIDQSNQIIVTGFPSWAKIPNLTLKQSYVIPMIISSAAQEEMGLSVDSAAQLRFSYTQKDKRKASTTFYLESRALMNRVSGFFAISSLPVLFTSGTILIPTEYFEAMLNPVSFDFLDDPTASMGEDAILEVRQAVLYVKLRKGITKEEREEFVNALQVHTNALAHTTTDTEMTVEQLKTIQNLIMLLLYFTSVICIILCAFMMWVTFISNVELNSWTFGVLRSLGFRTAQLMRSTVYEALCIVLSAFVFGLTVGTTVGITVAIVVCRILVIPLRINFPFALTLVIFGIVLMAAVVGPTASLRRLRNKPISSVLRGI
ncbi:hypothetical protein JKF63_04808 [Porcisia hertigi]|uniref:ABC3 transporter permease C-terminal domain-containing protein n=1 Tax=Porcisia hertigi TaxID=2761500 RepID=A0A836I3K0_9TRYP|nr:hypothetical protein JKF63_04808 [Porcisia hertigi]